MTLRRRRGTMGGASTPLSDVPVNVRARVLHTVGSRCERAEVGGDGPRPRPPAIRRPRRPVTTSAPSDPGLALVHDPAHGLSVTVRRHLDNAPVPEWRALAHRAGQPPFTGPDWLRAVHAHVGRGEPLLVSVRRDGELLAFGAFALLGGPRPLLTFLGAGGSDYAAVLTDPTRRSRRPARRRRPRRRGARGPGAFLDLEQVPAAGEQAEHVAAWARLRGYGRPHAAAGHRPLRRAAGDRGGVRRLARPARPPRGTPAVAPPGRAGGAHRRRRPPGGGRVPARRGPRGRRRPVGELRHRARGGRRRPTRAPSTVAGPGAGRPAARSPRSCGRPRRARSSSPACASTASSSPTPSAWPGPSRCTATCRATARGTRRPARARSCCCGCAAGPCSPGTASWTCCAGTRRTSGVLHPVAHQTVRLVLTHSSGGTRCRRWPTGSRCCAAPTATRSGAPNGSTGRGPRWRVRWSGARDEVVRRRPALPALPAPRLPRRRRR